jgi:hypothetical protein
MITDTNRKATKKETMRPATFGYMAGYCPRLIGTALASGRDGGLFGGHGSQENIERGGKTAIRQKGQREN